VHAAIEMLGDGLRLPKSRPLGKGQLDHELTGGSGFTNAILQ
jgi:hypothetical protein